MHIGAVAGHIDIDVINVGHRQHQRLRVRQPEALAELARLQRAGADLAPGADQRPLCVVKIKTQQHLVVEPGKLPKTKPVGGFLDIPRVVFFRMHLERLEPDRK